MSDQLPHAFDAFTRSILGSITDGFMVVDSEWRILYVNDVILARFGRPRHEVISAHLWRLFPDAVGQAAHHHMQQAMVTGRPVEYEVYYAPWDALLLDRCFPVDGVGLAVYSQDITERKRSERILAGERRVLEQIARGEPLAQVLAAVCALVESAQAGLHCTILLPDDARTRIASVVAPSLPPSFAEGMRSCSIAFPDETPPGLVFGEGVSIVIPDVGAATRFSAPWRALLEAHGVRACRSTPIVDTEGVVIASCTLLRKIAGDPSPVDPQLLDSAIQLAGIAITRQTALDRQQLAEQRFRITFDEAAVGVAHVGLDGHWLRVNRRLAAMLGYEAAELPGQRFQDNTFAEDLDADLEQVNELLRGARTTYTMEKRYLRKDRSIMWGHLTVSLARTADGAPDFFIAVVEDISARKQAEQALRESERRLAAILEQLPVGVGLLDADGRLVLGNALMRRFVPERIPSRSETERHRWRGWRADGSPLPPHEWPGARALRGEMVAPGVEFIYTHDDGQETWTSVGTAPLRGAEGQSDGALLIIQDIDASKRAEATLRYQSDLTRSITDNATTAIFMMDDRSRCTFMNPAAERMTGFAFHELSGRILHDYIHHHHPDGRPFPMSECPIDRALPESNEVHDHTDVFFRRNGEAFPVVCNARVIFERDRAVGTVIEVRDVTAERASAEAVERLMRDLKDADQRKDEFLAMLAHELRNPLAPIRNGLELIRLAADDHALVERTRTMMERQVGQMAHLIDDLMDISRISRGSITLQRNALSVADAVQDAVDLARPAITEQRHQLTVEMPEASIQVLADRTRMAQILANLLTNAAKYTPAGGQITLRVQLHDDDVMISVRDNGLGIPADMLDRIFEMFTQVHRPLQQMSSGLGVGLSIVKRLVEMHGGRIEARSDGPGAGSVFTLTLPRLRLMPDGEGMRHVG